MTDRIVTPGSEISPDTGIGYDFERVPAEAAAEPSAPHPESLVDGNRVSTGDELERDSRPAAD